MAQPLRIDELTAVASLSAAASVAIVQAGDTFRATPTQFITEAQTFTQSGTSPASLSVQEDIRKRPIYLSEYTGGVANGSTNATTAFANFVAACVAQGRKGIIDVASANGNAFMIDSFTFNATHAGLILEGQSFNPQGQSTGVGYFGIPSSGLKLRSASAAFIVFDACYNITFRNMVFDGDGKADVVHEWLGTSATTKIRFERCGIYGAVDATGKTIHYGGTIQCDAIVYDGCDINGFPGGSSIVPLHHVHNENTNSFLIDFEYCRFANAVRMFRYGNGSCSVRHSQVFGATTRFFEVDSTTKGFELEDVYTEQSAVPFFVQSGSAGGTGYLPITIKNCTLNHASNTMTLNCQQPVRLVDVATAGSITITPKATDGIHAVVDHGVFFLGSAVYAGAGATSNLLVMGGGTNSDDTWRIATTFTPTIIGTTGAGAGTYTAQYGSYTRLGNRVFFNLRLAWSAHTGTGNMRVSGLPFAAESTAANFQSVDIGFWDNVALTAGNVLSAYIPPGTTQITFWQTPTGGGAGAAVPIDTAADVALSGHYEL